MINSLGKLSLTINEKDIFPGAIENVIYQNYRLFLKYHNNKTIFSFEFDKYLFPSTLAERLPLNKNILFKKMIYKISKVVYFKSFSFSK